MTLGCRVWTGTAPRIAPTGLFAAELYFIGSVIETPFVVRI